MVSLPLEELERLKDKNRHQARQITLLQESLRQRNLELDSMHFVWCSGGCPGGVHRFSPDVELVTEELVERAERNVKRLRSWYDTVKWRLEKYRTVVGWHHDYADRAASKTDLT
jgi:hypothetical protein